MVELHQSGEKDSVWIHSRIAVIFSEEVDIGLGISAIFRRTSSSVFVQIQGTGKSLLPSALLPHLELNLKRKLT